MLAFVTSGMHTGWPSPSLPKLENSTLSISGDEGSWLAIMPLIGGPLGSIVTAATVDILGRKKAILLTSLPFTAAWFMVAFAKSVPLLCAARFIAGLADGCAFAVVPMYIGEVADSSTRGMLGSGAAVAWNFGILLICILGSYLSVTMTAFVSAAISVLNLVTLVWMPESPYHLIMNGKHNSAKKSLEILRGKHDVDAELGRISRAAQAQTQNKGKILELFTAKSNRTASLIMLGLRMFQQLCGSTAIVIYAQYIFRESGNAVSPELATIMYLSVQVLLGLICSSVIEKTGRRPLLIISMAGSAVTLFIEGTYFYLKTNSIVDLGGLSYIPIASLMGFVIVYSSGMQTIPTLMLGELFPTNVKAFALCLCDVYFYSFAAVASKLFHFMEDSYGLYMPFYFFTASSLLGLVFMIFVVPETKGKTLEEIQEELGGRTNFKENINEDIILRYASELFRQYEPSFVWTKLSMLRRMLLTYENGYITSYAVVTPNLHFNGPEMSMTNLSTGENVLFLVFPN